MECKHLSGLTVVFLLYLCLGAAIFQATESGGEQESISAMVEEYRNFVGNHTCVSSKDLAVFIEAMLDKIGPYGGLTRSRFDRNITKSLSLPRWDFPGAFTFSITVITTIGYGHIYPVSPIGRLICVVYALVGIPLTLLVLSGIGDQLNNIGRRIMSLKLCFESPNVNKALNMTGVVLAGIVVMFVVPTIVFVIVEGWDILKGLYYCFITLSTIGFGDYVAGNGDNIENETSRNIYRIVVYLWILIGLAYISLIIKSLSDLFVKKAEQVKEEAKKRVTISKLASLSSVSSLAAGFIDRPIDSKIDPSDTENGDNSPDNSVTDGPTMTYKKHGLKRRMWRSEHPGIQNGVKLVCVNSIKIENDELNSVKDAKERGLQENNNSAHKPELNDECREDVTIS